MHTWMSHDERRTALERAKAEADAADNALVAWLDRYPPGNDRPQSWHDEHRRLSRAAESAYNDYAELKYNVQ